MKKAVMRLCAFLVCVTIVFLTTACSPSAQSNIITRTYRSDKEQAICVFEEIIKAIENNDTMSLKEIFSVNTVRGGSDFEKDMNALMNFYEGGMVSYKQFGPGTHAIKEGSFQRKEMFASFDITTTVADYRMAIRLCTVDSESSENIGVYSLYIIEAENSDPDCAYWGNDVWNVGINIEDNAK